MDEPMTFDEIAQELRGLTGYFGVEHISGELNALADEIEERMELVNQRLYDVLLQKALKKEQPANSSAIHWHDAAHEPEEFVSVLLWCPDEKPLPTVMEGFYTEQMGYLSIRDGKCSPVMWAEMPKPPEEVRL